MTGASAGRSALAVSRWWLLAAGLLCGSTLLSLRPVLALGAPVANYGLTEGIIDVIVVALAIVLATGLVRGKRWARTTTMAVTAARLGWRLLVLVVGYWRGFYTEAPGTLVTLQLALLAGIVLCLTLADSSAPSGAGP